LARGPEVDEGFQAGEQAGEGGEDEGVQGRDQPGLGGGAVGLRPQLRREGGEVVGQEWGGFI